MAATLETPVFASEEGHYNSRGKEGNQTTPDELTGQTEPTQSYEIMNCDVDLAHPRTP